MIPNTNDRSVRSDRSDRSPRHLRPSGGYRDLRSFRIATLIYDGTVAFCDRWIPKTSRTHDQMVQAARSGRQNIAEGSRAAATSSQTELRLVNVARASLDELLLDFEDFLRQRGLRAWTKDDPETLEVRSLAKAHQTMKKTDPTDRTDRSDRSDRSWQFGPYAPWLTHDNPEVVANTLICLIHQANYLLDRQIAGLERVFVREGGYSESLAAARIAERETQQDSPLPRCPQCGKVMAQRTARKGPHAGSQFWGCTGYPDCKGTLPIDQDRSDRSDRSVRSDPKPGTTP